VPSTHNVEVPNVTKADYQLIDISDEDYMSLMTDDGSMKEDLKLPAGELGEQIKVCFVVVVGFFLV
jgi:translation initiation factor 5A